MQAKRYDAFAIGNRVAELRIQQKRGTQAHVAEKLGITPQTYSNIECGRHIMSMELMLKTSEYYNVSTDFLLMGRVTNTHDLEVLKDHLPHLEYISTLLHQLIK